VVASEYKQDRKKFNQHAKEWVQKYASPHINEGKISRLAEMGFTREQVEKTLLKHGYDEEKALEDLLSSA